MFGKVAIKRCMDASLSIHVHGRGCQYMDGSVFAHYSVNEWDRAPADSIRKSVPKIMAILTPSLGLCCYRFYVILLLNSEMVWDMNFIFKRHQLPLGGVRVVRLLKNEGYDNVAQSQKKANHGIRVVICITFSS